MTEQVVRVIALSEIWVTVGNVKVVDSVSVTVRLVSLKMLSKTDDTNV